MILKRGGPHTPNRRWTDEDYAMTKMTGGDNHPIRSKVRRNAQIGSPEEKTHGEIRKALYALCERFVVDNEIHCPEAIWQMDHVIGNAYEFIEEMCNIIGYAELNEDIKDADENPYD